MTATTGTHRQQTLWKPPLLENVTVANVFKVLINLTLTVTERHYLCWKHYHVGNVRSSGVTCLKYNNWKSMKPAFKPRGTLYICENAGLCYTLSTLNNLSFENCVFIHVLL